MKQNRNFTDMLRLQNKIESLKTRYIYKTKMKVRRHVIFTNQNNRKNTNENK